MMKVLIKTSSLLVLFAFVGLGFQSCKKCHVCTALDNEGNAVYAYPEVCGNNKDLQSYEDRCEAEYGSYDFNCSCGERQ